MPQRSKCVTFRRPGCSGCPIQSPCRDEAERFTRRGHDWTERYPAITSAAAKLRANSFTMDGEAVICGPDGIALFDAGALI
jgi:hypothetical protein